MLIAPALHAGTVLAPALSPRMQRAVRLLQMSSLDFSQLVRRALDTNPFLESDDALYATDLPDTVADPDAPGVAQADGQAGTEAGSPGDMEVDREPQAAGASRAEAGEGCVLDTLAAPGSLASHLATQLNVMPLPARDRVLALALVDCLEEDGYLRMRLEEAGAAAGLVPAADPQELMIALRRVQALDPAGVGARDLAECLLLQLAQVPGGVLRADRLLAMRIVREHLQALATCDAPTLARRLGVAREAVQAACDAIRRLDPRPGSRHGTHPTQYITPDVVVRRQRGQWVAALNPAVVPRVRVSPRYAQWFNRSDGDRHPELAAHLQEARWTVRNIEQRFATILAVSRAILQRQHRFLAYGPMGLRPLALREIADAVGVHESTVSRVTNNKFMATPSGVFELKYFFSRGLATAAGGTCSPTAIRTLIQALIAAEGEPLSDVAIAQRLARQGLRVARRTVTKYRQQLKIAPASRRRPGIR